MSSKLSYSELDSEELQALTDDLIILSTPSRHGKRRVSDILLSSPKSEGSSSSNSSSPAVSVRPIGFKTSFNFTFDLPEALLSVSALEFIGFTEEMAIKIYHRWMNRPDPDHNPDDLIDYVYGETLQLNEEPFRSYSSIEAMTGLGLSRDFQDAILDPQHSTVYGTQNLHYWINDTLRINYLTLELLQDRLKDCAGKSVAKKKKEKRAKLKTSSQFTIASSLGSDDRISRTATLNMNSKNHNLPQNWVVTQEADSILSDHYVLYKAKVASEMNEDQWIRDDGSIEMAAIASYPGGDFNFNSNAWYWTLESETAEQYRAFAARRCPWSDTWIIRIQISKVFVDGLRKEQLWYSHDWKEFVWYCRKMMTPPSRYDSFWKAGEVDIIEGHICFSLSTQVTRLRREEVQTNLTEADVMRNGSTKATQWAFVRRESADRLGQEVRGKIHIDITAAVKGQRENES